MNARLRLYLLGPPQIVIDDRVVAGLTSVKAEALFFYLAVTGRPHSRATLAALLWGDASDEAARASLRKALQPLRHHLGAFLHIDREVVGLAPGADYWVDATAFTAAMHDAEATVDEHTYQAIDLYRGDFLEGFYVRNAPDFEAWWQAEQTRLRELALHGLRQLADDAADASDLERAIALTRRLLVLEPWHEQDHRRLMVWLAHSGQRAAALAQFESCRQVLADELAVAPAAETVALLEHIRSGVIEPLPSYTHVPLGIKGQPPAFLNAGAEAATFYAQEPFVGREPQVAQLTHFLAGALSGHSQVAFVSGEAGWGKTHLLEAFSQRAQAAYPDLIVASGTCTAATGAGDPYLPFREILRMLAADVEQKWLAGSVSHAHTLRLWQFFPRVVEALATNGPHLIGAFVPQKALVQRAAVHRDIDPKLLQHIVEAVRLADGQGAALDRERIFEEIGDLFQALARHRPLLLILDDLHWADPSSVSLLFHLGRRLRQSPVLILGAYRPEEVALPRAGREHPLAAPLLEFRRTFGDVWLELDHGHPQHAQAFVDALLDCEPNRLSRQFRQALLRHTGGHPLFTVETLRDMKERGDLLRDEQGQWIARSALDWNILPARVEGVIETRIRRLDPDLRESLDIASVEGENFTAQVVGRVQGVDERTLVVRLDHEGNQRYRLVQELGIARVGGHRLSIYRFRHNLFQRYLYSVLSESRRAFLHEDVATVLEALYAEESGEIAVELAGHFQAAGVPARAIPHLHRAAQRASQLAADDEAIELLTRGLELLAPLPATAEHRRQALVLQIALGTAQGNAGHITTALATFQLAAALARELDAWTDLAAAALGYEEARWRYNLPAAPAVALLEEALGVLGDEEPVLRVRLMGGLVRARIASGAAEGVEIMAQQAVTAARRLVDPLALYDILRIYLFADRQPASSQARLAAASEMVHLGHTMRSRERLAEALGSRIHEHLEGGDIAGVDADLEAHTRAIQDLQQPFFLHTNALFMAARKILAGEFAEGERLAQRALQFGQRIGTENAISAYGMQMFTIRREQGQLHTLAPIIQRFVEQNPASATWRPGLALIYSELGWQPAARSVLEELAVDNFAGIARDAFWVSTIAYLSEVCAALGDANRAAILYPLLLPHQDRTVVVGLATACFGAVARFLGLLAMTLARWEDAEQHFSAALALNAHMGARPWLAHTQHQYAVMLLARSHGPDRARARALLDMASSTAAELGMLALGEKIATAYSTIPA